MQASLEHKRILLGVTGGIAIYKSADLVRRLREAGAEVRVVMTNAAKSLMTPLAFQALSGYSVLSDWDGQSSEFAMDHIALTRWADLILIAPCTADFMAKLAHGLADDVLSTLCLAATVPILVAPAMNKHMWDNPATQFNKAQLEQRGASIIPPESGAQVCGDVGVGRMVEVDAILSSLVEMFSKTTRLQEVRVLITAGPTQEPIDPVRFISNHSSGKMGYALAEAAAAAGAKVTLVSGPCQLTLSQSIEKIAVITAQQMFDAVMAKQADCDIFIAVAAVADYHCVNIASQKMSKGQEELTLVLQPTPDILAAVAQQNQRLFTVGFAAETEHVVENARGKLHEKHLQLIIANDVSQANIGFHSDQNACIALWDQGEKNFSARSKRQLAVDLLDLIAILYSQR